MKNLSSAALYEKLVNDIKALKTPRETVNHKDDRYWTPTVGEDGNGSAIIRFLPPKAGESDAWAHYFSHSFKDPDTNRWYIENSLTSIGKKDPVGVLNSELWKQGENSPGQAQAKRQKRTENYVSNILVVKDPGNRENEGKTFLYRYGKKIFEKITGAMMDNEELGTSGKNVFDLEKGCNFILKIKNVKSGQNTFRNYDDSSFGDPSSVDVDLESLHSLAEIKSEDNFKSYEDLEKRLNYVLGLEEGEPEDRSSKSESKPEPKKETPAKAPAKKAESKPVDEVPFDVDVDLGDIDAMISKMNLGD